MFLALNVQSNTTVRKTNNSISIDETIPMEKLIVLEGSWNASRLKVLKDDRHNTNLVFQKFFAKIGKNLNWSKCDIEGSHPKRFC